MLAYKVEKLFVYCMKIVDYMSTTKIVYIRTGWHAIVLGSSHMRTEEQEHSLVFRELVTRGHNYDTQAFPFAICHVLQCYTRKPS